MKRLVVLLVLISVLISACSSGSRSSLEYEIWKDTKAAFGNGNYQILHGYRDKAEISTLYNCKHNQEVVTNVEKYVEKDNYVFFVGDFRKQKVFCKLNVETNLLTYHAEEDGDEYYDIEFETVIEDKQFELLSSYEDFSEEDKTEFKRLMEN